MPAKTVGAAEFKANCLRLIDEMNLSNIPIIVTNRGRPVAEMFPVRNSANVAKPFIGSMKGTVYSFNDPFTPAMASDEWEAMQ